MRMALVDPRRQGAEGLAHLFRGRIADGVGHVQRPGAGVGGGLQHIGQEFGLGAEGVFGRELDVIEQAGGVFDRPHRRRQHLVGGHLQLGGAVDRAGADEGVAAAMRLGRRLQGAEGGVDVLFVGARQGAEDRPLDLASHAADAVFVARRGGGEAGLDNVDAQVLQDLGHLHLGLGAHGEAGRLFPVPHRRVEDDDPVGVGGDLLSSGYAGYSYFFGGHYAASD